MTRPLQLHVGVKTDPIEYRYSFEWLFRILGEEGIRHVQIGTFFELYHLPDRALTEIRQQAEEHGLEIASVFTSHRELGGFFRGDPSWEAVARRQYERLIRAGAILGARNIGSNPGTVPRDELDGKAGGIERYLHHLKELLHVAREEGIECLTLEPMSCSTEPPTFPDEIRGMIGQLLEYHGSHPEKTAAAGVCADVSHGYADHTRKILHQPLELLEVALPYTREIHLKNTDASFESTFGFTSEERRRGIVDIAAVRDLLLENEDQLPVREIIGYLEMGGPKTGRDYSDVRLEDQLRESLQYLKAEFSSSPARSKAKAPQTAVKISLSSEPRPEAVPPRPHPPDVLISPSLMCADMTRIAEEVRRLEDVGCDWLHFDIMDAHFVPNMPLGLELLKHVRPLTTLPFDVHLMVDNNDFFIEQLSPIGPQYISVHVESSTHLDRTLQLIRSTGARAGAALNPATPLSALDYVLDHLDFVLIMTVNPGYAGQSLVPSAFRKIAAARDYLREHGLDVPIQVDGNVSFPNIPEMVAEGASVLVAGTSSLYHEDRSMRENMALVREACAQGLALRKERSAPGPGGDA